MAKIIKVGSQNPTFTSQKIANPFKTARKAGATDPFERNPFMYSNFEGTTLPFADVFEGFKPSFKGGSKLKMVAASVTGSMTKLRNSVEPIVNFAKRVYTGTRDGVAAAWNLAFRTPISEVPGLKNIPGIKRFDDAMSMEVPMPSFAGIAESMNLSYLHKDIREVGKDMMQGVHSIGEGITNRMEALNNGVADMGRAIADKCTAISFRARAPKINAEMPVAELEQLWRNEIEAGEVVA